MDIIPYNINLFEDGDLGSLKEFEEILNEIPYQRLIQTLDAERKNGRKDYSNESLFRVYMARFIFKHPTIQSVIDELKRNPSLRILCRIEPKIKKDGTKQLAPDNAVFTRFEARLKKHQTLVDDIFETMNEELATLLDDYGETLALDGKIVESYANRPSKKEKADGRRELDADYTQKKYTATTDKGEIVIKKQTYFGFRIHLLVDTKYEQPLMFQVTAASKSEKTVAKKMVSELPSWLTKRANYLMADRGYDGRPLQEKIENQGIIPIIDICNMWKNGEQTKQYKDTDFVYTYNGQVFYVDEEGRLHPAYYKGYHKASNTLRYETHPKDGIGIKKVAIKREEDARIFNIVARDSKKFERYYKQRTAVERVNGRIDRDYLFENHTIRGLEKMKLRVSLCFITMLARKKVEIKTEKARQAA